MNRIIRFCALLVLVLAAFSCSRHADRSERHYQLSGRVTALNAKDGTATLDAAAIPGFMEAMTMEYPVKSKQDFSTLHIGDKITATVNVRDDATYDLSNIKPAR